MKLKLQLIFIIIIIAFGKLEMVFAQRMIWSTPQRITSKNYFTEILGQNYAGLYYLQTAKNSRDQNVSLLTLDYQLKTKAKEVFITGSKEGLVRAVLLNHSVVLFYTVFDKKDKVINLYAKQLDANLLSIIDDRKILSINTNSPSKELFRIVPNRKRDKILVITPKITDSLNNNLNVMVLNKNCVEEARQSLEITGLSANYEITNSQFVDDHYFVLLKQEKREGLFKKEVYKSLVSLNLNNGSILKRNMYNTDFNIRSGHFTFDNQQRELIFSAYYFKDDSLNPQGFYQMSFATAHDTARVMKTPFPKEMLQDLFGLRGNPKLKMLFLMKTVRRTDGGTIYISEKKEVDEQQLNDVSVYGIQQNYVRYYYYYYEISILSVNPDGSTDWHKTIKKEQISLNDEGYYSSFGCEVLKDRIYFIYNDLSKKASNIYLYSVKPNGDTSGDILIKGKEFEGYAIPKESVQLSSNELLVPLIKIREGFTFLKMMF